MDDGAVAGVEDELVLRIELHDANVILARLHLHGDSFEAGRDLLVRIEHGLEEVMPIVAGCDARQIGARDAALTIDPRLRALPRPVLVPEL